MDDDKIFDKPKRKLSEKQLANLAKGREKMRLKRLVAKGQKVVRAADKSGSNEHKKTEKEAIKKKRRTMKEIAATKEAAILAKLEKQEASAAARMDALESSYLGIKTQCLAKAKSVAERREIKEALEGLNGNVLSDDVKLEAYARSVMMRYAPAENIFADCNEEEYKEQKQGGNGQQGEEGFDGVPDQAE